MKDKITVVFRRLASGESLGDIVDGAGAVLESKSFGEMTAKEFDMVMDLMNLEDPILAGKLSHVVELTGN